MDDSSTLSCDLIVVGGGMAGLSAAARASEAGANVVLVEKADKTGGSGALSGGYVWYVPAVKLLSLYDDGDLRLARVVVDNYEKAVAWLKSRDVLLTRPLDIFYGRGYQSDVLRHLALCEADVTSAGGAVVTGTTVEKLVTDNDGAVIGVSTKHPSGDVELRAPWTILATGGAQGSPEWRATHIHENARTMFLRSNPNSKGDGLALAMSVGGYCTTGNNGFYGHLMCHPLRDTSSNRFVEFSQMHSSKSLVLNKEGKRFADESLAYYKNAQSLVRQPDARGLLIWDQVIQSEMTAGGYIANKAPMDKFEIARSAGAQCTSGTLDEIAAFASTVGFNGANVKQTVLDYNHKVVHAPETLHPPRVYNWRPVDQAPFYATVVEPAITFSHGGIVVDEQARVLRSDGRPIKGLLCAGADAGDVYRGGYGGGLSLALTYAFTAVKTAGWLRS